jgi:hypothetical protein
MLHMWDMYVEERHMWQAGHAVSRLACGCAVESNLYVS